MRMCRKLRHRGPDASEVLVQDDFGLGFSRLSIIDLQTGMQPMANEDKSVLSVCNGEIFNFPGLADELRSKGHTLRTKSDCEVLPHLYEDAKEKMLQVLNGQFAFAICDGKLKRLFAARDPFGVAPFFFTLIDGLFIFASEIKAILEHGAVTREVNPVGLDQVFTFPGVVSPETMFKNIHSLPPGHFLQMEKGATAPVIEQYWDLAYPKLTDYTHSGHPDEYAEQVWELLRKSVNRRLVSDVPIGLYLSGGLDSSLIGVLARELSAEVRHSFSVDFLEAELSEGRYQRLMAKELGTVHHPVLIEGQDIAAHLQRVIFHCECPLKETFNAAALALSGAVHEHGIKVVLAGQGADELFGGYIGYRFDAFHSASLHPHKELTSGDRQLNESLWGEEAFVYERQLDTFRKQLQPLYSENLRGRTPGPDCLQFLRVPRHRVANVHSFHRRSYIDFKLRLADHLLGDHGDRMTFAHGVEARYPFLDRELVEFIRTIPVPLQLQGFDEKALLKRIARRVVPSQIVEREKFGFAAPGSPLLLRQNCEFINDILSPAQITKDGYFDPAAVESLRRQYEAPGFRINVPFEIDLLAVVLTFGIFRELFDLPQLN